MPIKAGRETGYSAGNLYTVFTPFYDNVIATEADIENVG